MSVDLAVGERGWPVGAPSFLFAFFSTVSVRLEPEGWGTRFGAVMDDLYNGELAPARVPAARAELATIRAELAELPPTDLVWNVEQRDERPPWGDDVPPEVTDLARYFVTSDGEPLLDVLDAALAHAEDEHEPVLVT